MLNQTSESHINQQNDSLETVGLISSHNKSVERVGTSNGSKRQVVVPHMKTGGNTVTFKKSQLNNQSIQALKSRLAARGARDKIRGSLSKAGDRGYSSTGQNSTQINFHSVVLNENSRESL